MNILDISYDCGFNNLSHFNKQFRKFIGSAQNDGSVHQSLARYIIHGKQTERVPEAYRRYLINRFRKAFKLRGTPVRLSFRTSENPYKGRRNKLTPRQQRRRKRMMKHAKK